MSCISKSIAELPPVKPPHVCPTLEEAISELIASARSQFAALKQPHIPSPVDLDMAEWHPLITSVSYTSAPDKTARLLIEPVEEWNISSGGFHSREGSFYLGGNVEGVGFKGVVFKVPEEVKERKMVLDLGMSVFGNGARLVLRAEGWGDGEEGEVDSDEEFEYL